MERIRKISKRRSLIILATAIILLFAATGTYVFFIAPSITSSTTISTSQDYNLWVQPYLPQLAKIEAVLTQPYSPGSKQSYGYDSALGVTCGANIEPSPAIGVQNGYNNACVLIDNNLEGGASLDYLASSSSPLIGQPGFNQMNLQIYTNTRNYLSKSFYGVGACPEPFSVYNYPGNFTLLDMREAEYGFAGPYVTQLLQPGIQIGGIGNNCGTQGQTWFLENYDNPDSTTIVTELPSSEPLTTSANMDELSFVIDELYMQCIAGKAPCSQWQVAYQNAMSQYPFQAPRDALHFIQCTRATGAWAMSNMSYDSISAKTMLQNTIARLFTSEAEGGALGPNGGLSQSWGAGGDRSPEPNFQAMVAFDPRMPSWFTLTCMNNQSTCALS